MQATIEELHRATEGKIKQSHKEGACPVCFHQEPVRTDIGTLRRRILSGTFVHISTDLEFASPLSGVASRARTGRCPRAGSSQASAWARSSVL